jgi:predicted GNAT family N-acyltransferase
MITYCNTSSITEIEEILQLQHENLKAQLPPEEISSQGFVTVPYSKDMLIKMSLRHSHIISKNERGQVIGYALVLLRENRDLTPTLNHMFDEFEKIFYQDKLLKKYQYFVMGQVCIKKPYRGIGVFNDLYLKLKKEMSPNFQLVLTEIATKNERSLSAHKKIGFEIVRKYFYDGEEWNIVLWNWE